MLACTEKCRRLTGKEPLLSEKGLGRSLTMRLMAATVGDTFSIRHGSLQLAFEEKSPSLMTDLSMVAQGFRPSPSRATELVDAGFVWVMIAKPPQLGLTALDKTTLISRVCDDALLDPAELATAAELLTPSVTDFASDTAFLDELESRARSSQKIRPTLEKGGFLLWLLADMPSTAPPLRSPSSCQARIPVAHALSP